MLATRNDHTEVMKVARIVVQTAPRVQKKRGKELIRLFTLRARLLQFNDCIPVNIWGAQNGLQFSGKRNT